MPKKTKARKKTSVLSKFGEFFKSFTPSSAPPKRSKKSQKYRTFKLQKKIKAASVENFGDVLKRAYRLIYSSKLTLLLHSLIFGLLYLVFVRGIGAGLDISAEIEAAGGVNVANSIGAFGSVFTSAGEARTSAGSVLQVILFIVFSLSLLWLLRTIRSKEKNINVLDAYYFGPSQAIPYMLVFVFTLIQLIPVTLGNSIITTAQRNNLIISNFEQVTFIVLAASLAAVSFFLVSGALFGLIVVSLPNTKPLESIRAGHELVRHRRWPVAARLFLFVLLIMLVTFIITIPFILFLPTLAEYIFYVCSVATLVFGHAFVYELYRGLLKK